MDERWLPVRGFEGFYEVSDLGRVRSVDRTIVRSDGKIKRFSGRMLRQHTGPGTHGYPTVGLSRNGKGKNRLVHQLVLQAFKGECPEGQESLHGPAGKSSAALSNLRYGTRAENVGHDRRRDGQDNAGEHNGQHKLTVAEVEEVRARVAAGETQRAVARRFGVHFSTINMIVLGRTWRES